MDSFQHLASFGESIVKHKCHRNVRSAQNFEKLNDGHRSELGNVYCHDVKGMPKGAAKNRCPPAFYYCCNLMVSTIAMLLICLIGRLIAIPADARQVKIMIKSELTGIVHPVPHFSAIKN